MPGIGVERSQAYDAGDFIIAVVSPVMSVDSCRTVLRRLAPFSHWRWALENPLVSTP